MPNIFTKHISKKYDNLITKEMKKSQFLVNMVEKG